MAEVAQDLILQALRERGPLTADELAQFIGRGHKPMRTACVKLQSTGQIAPIPGTTRPSIYFEGRKTRVWALTGQGPPHKTRPYVAREGVTVFKAGSTPGWGDLEFHLNGVPVEGIHSVDVREGTALVYARDPFGNWPIFNPNGTPVVASVYGYWTVHVVLDEEPEAPRKRNRKKKKVAA
jgi:hypothetical protein